MGNQVGWGLWAALLEAFLAEAQPCLGEKRRAQQWPWQPPSGMGLHTPTGWMLGRTRCGTWARSYLAGGGVGGEPGVTGCLVRLLARMCPTLGQVRLVGRGPVDLTLPARGFLGSRARSCLPILAGQTMSEMQGLTPPGYCLREREGKPGRAAPTASPGPAGTWGHWARQLLPSTTQRPLLPRRELLRGAHPSRSPRSQPHPSPAPKTREKWLRAGGGGAPGRARCLGRAPRGSGGSQKHVVASLLPLLVLLSFSLSTLCDRGWGSSGGALCPLLPRPPRLRQ